MLLNPLSLMGSSYADNALSWSAQRTLNWLPETAEVEGTRTPIKFADPPGLRAVVDLGTDRPIRGLENVEGTLFAVSGTSLFEISTAFGSTNRGNIPGVTRVSMAHNKQGGVVAANELVIANGLSGYVYNTNTATLSQITDDAFQGANTVDYVDGYITFTDPQGRFWGHSALNQATGFSSIDRYDAESAPDPIISHIVSHREVMVFGSRTIEFFRNTGAATGTFQRVNGTEQEVGICAPFARSRIDNSVCWVSDSLEVFRLEEHQPQRISTRPIEQLLHTVNPANIFTFAWEDRGHKVFYVTAPEAFTVGFDFASGMWHERQTFDIPRWRANALVPWNGYWIAGDYSNGLLYVLDWDTHHENGLPLIRERASGYTHGGQNKVLAPYVELLFDVGPDGDLPQIVGDVPDGEVGEAITGEYIISGGIAPYSVSVQSGTFPPGLTLGAPVDNGDGTYSLPYSGTYSTIGTYSWTVGGEDAFGVPFSVEDSAIVAQVSWWMTTTSPLGSNRATVWQSNDNLTTWPVSGLRTPNNSNQPVFGALLVDTGVVLVAGNTANLDRITDFDSAGGYTTTSVPLTLALTSSAIVRSFGQVVVVCPFSSSNRKYFTSNDYGATFTERLAPNDGSGNRGLRDVARLEISPGVYRWVASMDAGPGSAFLYSNDQGEPVTWVGASQAGIATGNKLAVIACNGSAAATMAVGGGARTTDGLTWTATSAPVGTLSASEYDSYADGSLFLLGENGGGAYFRSVDAGASWTRITGQPQFQRFQAIGTRIVASVGAAAGGVAAKYSDDQGLTWTTITGLPYSVAVGDGVRIVRIRYTTP